MRTRKAINLSLESLEKRDVPSAIRSIYNYPQDKNVGIRIALGNALERSIRGNTRAFVVLQGIYADHIHGHLNAGQAVRRSDRPSSVGLSSLHSGLSCLGIS